MVNSRSLRPRHDLRTMQAVVGERRYLGGRRLGLSEHPVLADRAAAASLDLNGVGEAGDGAGGQEQRGQQQAPRPAATAAAKERKNASTYPRPQLDTPGLPA